MEHTKQAEDVRSFVKLTNLTQTSQLHEWNLESLCHALQVASAAEDAVSDNHSHQDVELHIRQWFPVATLPTLPLAEALTVDALRHARMHLLRSILQSSFLASHPTRSELLVAVLDELRTRRDDSLSFPLEEQLPDSALLTEKVVRAPRMDAMLAIARRLSDRCKRVRVQVLSGEIFVLPLKSYALSPRTLQLRAMAKTLQRNAVDARAAIQRQTYASFLTDLQESFTAAASDDVREVVVLMLVMCEWPEEEPLQLRGMKEDLVNIVREWVTCKPMRFYTFQPWLAAMLASQSEHFASTYVSALFDAGLLQPYEREFAERVATMALQTQNVQHLLQQALKQLDPNLQRAYFNVNLDGATSLHEQSESWLSHYVERR